MDRQAAIAASLVDMRNVGAHKSLKLTLHVPEELALDAIAAFGWPTGAHPVSVAIARLAGEGVTVERGTDSHAVSRSPRKASTEKRLAAQAGMLCADPMFQKFLSEVFLSYVSTDEEGAAQIVRNHCDIASRSEIVPGSPAAARWDNLYSRFIAWRDAPELVA